MDSLISIFNISENEAAKVLQLCDGNLERSIDYLLSNNNASMETILPPPHMSQLPPSPPPSSSSSLLPTASSSPSLPTSEITNLEISQYSFENGASSCTSICLSVITKLLQQLVIGDNIHNVSTLSDALIGGISIHNNIQKLNASLHLAVDEVYFSSTEHQNQLVYVVDEPYQGLLNNSNSFQVLFDKILVKVSEKYSADKHVACIMTKPPETLCIILPPKSAQNRSCYHLFDSHARPNEGHHGAYLISDNLQHILEKVKTIWPAFNDNENELGYMMEMYNMYEIHPFQLKDNDKDWIMVNDDDTMN